MGYLADTRLAAVNVLLVLPLRRLRIHVLTRWLHWEIGEQVSISRGLVLTELWGPVRIGNRVNIGRHLRLDTRGGVTIGDDVDIAQHVTVLTAEHDPDTEEFRYRERPVVVGNRCWIATSATLLPGTVMEDGAVLGAAAVAHGRLAAFGIHVGNPARESRKRRPGAQARMPPYVRYWQ